MMTLASVKKIKKGPFVGITVLVSGVIVYILLLINTSVDAPTIKVNDIKVASTGAALTWPTYGEQAIGVLGGGVLATNGEQKSQPIASIAKLMLAHLVVQQKPLDLNQPGPILTLTQADVDLYTSYLAQNGSVVPVAVGEKISEYQMLQALLLPSGDNIADTLAIWVYGSTDSYLAAANAEANSMGLKQTHFADASGLSPQTVSSASDLVLLGSEIMKQPVLAEIVGQAQVTLPVAGLVYNVDSLLGRNGIVGIKTGNTDEAGGCFLSAVNSVVGDKTITTITAILGAPSLSSVLHDTVTFLNGNTKPVDLTTPVKAGQVVGSYVTAWGQTVNVLAKTDLSLYVAGNQGVTVSVLLDTLDKPANENDVVGKVIAQTGQSSVSVPAVLSGSIAKPPVAWRLLHPLGH